MKAKITILSLLITTLVFNTGCKKYPYAYKLEHLKAIGLKKPNKALDYARTSADFWKKTYDAENGGFFTTIALNGDVLGGYYKTTLSQSRIAYAFARAYMLTGEQEYLKYANYAIDFLINKCSDKKNGGFYTTVDFKGKNIDFEYDNELLKLNKRQKQKWSFMQHYALLGLTALVEATRNDKQYNFLIKCRTLLDEKLYDNRKGIDGYFESADYDWRNPRGKGFTPTMDGITTHGLSLYLLTNNQKYKQRLISLADNVIEHMYPTAKEWEIGFDEYYDSNWKQSDMSYVMIGHMLKTAWCLQRIYLLEPKSAYKETAEKIMQNINQKAWDNTKGGPYYMADGVRGIISDDNKNYWTLEQGITSGLISYYVTGNPLYLKMADEALSFYEQYIIDHDYGDVFDNVKANGERIHIDENEHKGSYWKSAYHSLETAYYTYLYGNLFIYNREVRLFYYFEKTSKSRIIPMNPIPEIRKLVIAKVEHNGKAYINFSANKRLLTVPAGTGGEFKVWYVVRK